jgi:hypothetical protein
VEELHAERRLADKHQPTAIAKRLQSRIAASQQPSERLNRLQPKTETRWTVSMVSWEISQPEGKAEKGTGRGNSTTLKPNGCHFHRSRDEDPDGGYPSFAGLGVRSPDLQSIQGTRSQFTPEISPCTDRRSNGRVQADEE